MRLVQKQLASCWFLLFINGYRAALAQDVMNASTILNDTSRSGRSLCMPMLRSFNLELRHLLRPNVSIGLTGDHRKLGAWQVHKSVQMHKRDKVGLKWYVRLMLCASTRVSYRYFAFKQDRWHNKRILQWEAQMHPRYLQYYEMYHKEGNDYFGEIHEQAVDSFSEDEPGWLRHEYTIELQFIWPAQLNFGMQKRTRNYLLKLYKLDDSAESPLSNMPDDDVVIVASRYSYKHSSFKVQPSNGIRYADGDIVVFRITLPLGVAKSYQLRIYAQNSHPLALVDIPADELTDSGGVLQLPIYDYETRTSIGTMQLPYLVVRPLHSIATSINFMASFQHYWPANWPTIEIAQRGMGASFYAAKAPHIENTLASFMAAEQQHADMLQLNVVLTKDYVPIVWHDFGFYTASTQTRKIKNVLDLQYRLINELTYNQLKAQRVFVQQQGVLMEYTHLNTRNASQMERLFITLAEVYAHLPNTLGLMLDIKWPQQLQSGMYESEQSLDKNLYVDALLELTQTDACGRPLIFASFNADICTMLRLKQHSFPVVLLTYGSQPTLEPYRDLRTRSYMSAINFAASASILGTAPHAYEFVSETDRLNFGLDLNQAVFLWGDILNDHDLLFKFRSVQASGLIYSRVDRYLPNTKRSSFFKASELQEIFAKQCFIAVNATTRIGISNAYEQATALTTKSKLRNRFTLWPKF